MINVVTFNEIDYTYGVVVLHDNTKSKFVIHDHKGFKNKLGGASNFLLICRLG